jgi:hypothetical protein
MHVRSHSEVVGLFSCCALRNRCHVRESVALSVLEISWPQLSLETMLDWSIQCVVCDLPLAGFLREGQLV